MSSDEGLFKVSFEKRVTKFPKNDITPIKTIGENPKSLAKSTAEGAKNVPKYPTARLNPNPKDFKVDG